MPVIDSNDGSAEFVAARSGHAVPQVASLSFASSAFELRVVELWKRRRVAGRNRDDAAASHCDAAGRGVVVEQRDRVREIGAARLAERALDAAQALEVRGRLDTEVVVGARELRRGTVRHDAEAARAVEQELQRMLTLVGVGGLAEGELESLRAHDGAACAFGHPAAPRRQVVRDVGVLAQVVIDEQVGFLPREERLVASEQHNVIGLHAARGTPAALEQVGVGAATAGPAALEAQGLDAVVRGLARRGDEQAVGALHALRALDHMLEHRGGAEGEQDLAEQAMAGEPSSDDRDDLLVGHGWTVAAGPDGSGGGQGGLSRNRDWPGRGNERTRGYPPRAMLSLDPHPRLCARAFVTQFLRPVGESEVPVWLHELHRDGAPAPLCRSEELRGAVRDLLRHGGYKPTGRGKPSSEYLARAAVEGGLPRINLAVDACNAVSLHSGLPISVVDLDRAQAPLRIGIAGAGERYVFNAAGQEIDIEGLLNLFDAAGPCANAVKDAQRTKTHPGTLRTLSVLWGVVGHETQVERACAWYRELLERAGAGTSGA